MNMVSGNVSEECGKVFMRFEEQTSGLNIYD